MADYKSVIVTAIDAGNPEIVDKSEYLGNLCYIPIKFITDFTTATKTVLISETLPPSAKLVGLSLAFTALAGSATVDIGYVGTSTGDLIIDGFSVASAALVTYPMADSGTNGGNGEAIDVGGKSLLMTLIGAAMSTDTIGGYALITTNE